MQRFAGEEIKAWIQSPRRKPLIVRGARQVGKTWLIEHVAATAFDSFVKIDLEKRRDLHACFEGNLDPVRIVQHIEMDVGTRIRPGTTLLFFDEIQACPRAITSLRYFYEQMPQLHVVAAGSLLEFALHDASVPVGRVQYLPLYPMTFREYLLAQGNQPCAQAAEAHPETLAEELQRVLLRELRTFFFVGGMPECVRTFRDTGSLIEVGHVQREILDSFRDDFAKYRPQVDRDCLDAVLLSAARHGGERVQYTKLDPHHTGPTNRRAFDLLVQARVLHKIPSCDPSGLPLGASASTRRFKAAFLDIGLLQCLCQVPINLELQQGDLLAMYRGMLAEQFVAQEMIASGEGELFYWSREARSSTAEVDFVVAREGRIVPVEVKSGAGGRLRSLHLFLQTYPHAADGCVLYDGTYATIPEQRIRFYPLYWAGMLRCGSQGGG